jgi:hypothetical protein
MIIRRRLNPGQPGTKKLVSMYGEQLVCVRYRYDTEKNEVIKTVEIVVERKNWKKGNNRIPGNKVLSLRIAFDESHLRRLVKAAGGRWNKRRKVWELPYKDIKALGLESRILED